MRNSLPTLSIAALCAVLASCTTAPTQTTDGAASLAGSSIIADALDASMAASAPARIEADVRWLADDARRGREAGTPGYNAAADFVAARFDQIGLEPGGADGGWFQQVPLRAFTPVLEAAKFSMTDANGDTHVLTHLEDFTAYTYARSPEFEIRDVPTVFVGYGVYAPEAGHNDYEGLDLEGKVVVYLSGAPDFFDSEQRAHYGSGSLKSLQASARGAIAVMPVQTISSKKTSPWERVIANPSSVSMTWLHPDGSAETSGPNLKGGAFLHYDKARLLFDGAAKSYDEIMAEADADGGAPKGFDLAATVSFAAADTSEVITSPNVVGVIPGNDPQLINEYVVLTAHLDHTGVNQKLIDEGKDGINNGALDNAMGVATMLEAAKRLVDEGPVARSVIVLAVTAEEKGLLGADYYAHFPTVPLDSIVANVNLDMPLVLHSFTDVVAFGAERSSLGAIVDTATGNANVTLSPDPIPEQGIFTRSDHYRFVEKGVPAVFLVPGFANGGGEIFQDFLATHYHKPSDDVSLPIRYDDAARFADVNYEIAKAIANAPERPSWNEGDFFGDLFGRGGE